MISPLLALRRPLRAAAGRLQAQAHSSTIIRRHLAAAGSPTSVRVEETREEGGSAYALKGRSGRHALSADLMPQMGGKDTGPSPKEYVLMALGSCTAITMRMYGENMIKSGKWPGRTIRRLAVECEEVGEEEQHLPAGIKVTVSLDADLDEEQTRRLLAAAGKCPVKRMLKGELREGFTMALAGVEGSGK
jgi:putative redox protein